MKKVKKSILLFLVLVIVLLSFSCNRGTGKNVKEGCGTWGQVTNTDTTRLSN